MLSTAVEHITKSAGVCGGRATVAGHRIRVVDIVVLHELRGCSPDEIAAIFPGLSLSDIHAALAYYFDHRSEIKEELQADDKAALKLLKRHKPKVKGRLSG